MRFLRDETLRPLIFTDGKSRNVCAGSGERIGDAALAEAVAKIERVFGGGIVIEAQTKLVFVLRLRERGDEGGTACVRQRIERENVLRNRIDARQLIERNGLRRLSLRNEYVVKLVIPSASCSGL